MRPRGGADRSSESSSGQGWPGQSSFRWRSRWSQRNWEPLPADTPGIWGIRTWRLCIRIARTAGTRLLCAWSNGSCRDSAGNAVRSMCPILPSRKAIVLRPLHCGPGFADAFDPPPFISIPGPYRRLTTADTRRGNRTFEGVDPPHHRLPHSPDRLTMAAWAFPTIRRWPS